MSSPHLRCSHHAHIHNIYICTRPRARARKHTHTPTHNHARTWKATARTMDCLARPSYEFSWHTESMAKPSCVGDFARLARARTAAKLRQALRRLAQRCVEAFVASVVPARSGCAEALLTAATTSWQRGVRRGPRALPQQALPLARHSPDVARLAAYTTTYDNSLSKLRMLRNTATTHPRTRARIRLDACHSIPCPC